MTPLKNKMFLALAGLTLVGASVLPASTVLAASPQNINAKLNFEQAHEAALKKAKKGTVTEIEIETKKNKPRYEVTVLNAKTEKEYELDANSGKILKQSTEDIGTDKEELKLSKATPKLSLKEALKKVQEKHSAAQLREIKLDFKNEQLVYKVKLQDKNKKIKLVLNADDGTIITETTK